MNRRHDDERPILITEAPRSAAEEFAARKRRYSLIMACRIPCLVLAGVFGIAFNLPVVAVLLIVLSVPLPWVAVLIANDRLPQKAGRVNKYQQRARRVQNTDRKVIEAARVLDARDAGRRPAEGQVVDVGPPDPDPHGADTRGADPRDADPRGADPRDEPGADRRAG